jgi:predicted Zn-dependent protease
MMLSKDQAFKILDRALTFADADETEISLSGNDSLNLRFARNMRTTNGRSNGLSLAVSCVRGTRVGAFSTTQVDDASLKDAVARAAELAKYAPENPEYMPRLGAQTYIESNEWDEATSRLAPDGLAAIAKESIDAAEAKQLISAGYFEQGAGFSANANSRGHRAYRTSTSASYTLTMRTPDGMGSGWCAQESFRAASIDGRRVTDRAIDKALRSHNPEPIDPGKYPVILEASPAGDMLNLFHGNLDRRSADEGRSYFSEKGGGTKLGQSLFGPNITIRSDHTNSVVPSSPWGEDGLPLAPRPWVENGTVKNLAVSRYWGKEKSLPVIPMGSNIMMKGEEHSLDDLIASMDHGLLVTSFWYIREVDPQTILFTGLTRDGVFMIENGKITRPVKNMRWNESPAAIYKCVEMMSRPERVVTREGNPPMLAPALKLKEFTFTSVSESI